MDQEASAIRQNQSSTWTPLRVLLLVLGTVVLGVALSLLLGSSPAHAAESDDPGSGNGLLGGVSSAIDQTVNQSAPVASAAFQVAAPLVEHVDRTLPARVSTTPIAATVDTITSGVESTSPVLATVMTPVTSPISAVLHGALETVDQLVQAEPTAEPTAEPADAFANSLTADAAVPAPVIAQVASTLVAVPIDGPTVAFLNVPSLPGSGSIPVSAVTSRSSVPAGVLGMLFALAAFALLGARRRASDDELPSSPVFETDTSPA